MFMENVMLNQVKSDINLLSNDTFAEHFNRYVMKIQDMLIDVEFRQPSLLSQKLSPLMLLRAMDDEFERMQQL